MANDNRLNWSRKRVIILVIASMTSAAVIASIVAQSVHSNVSHLHPLLWLAGITNILQWCAYLATTLRDEIRHELATSLREEIREEIRTEVGKLLQPIDSKIEEIDQEVCDYGDRKQAEGAALALKIVGQRGHTGRHLNPVD